MIAVFDDFIQDKQLLEDIANDSSFFSDPGIYRYWKGWWTSEPKNVKQRLIEYIWKDNLPIKLDAQINGFEYWTGIQSAEDTGHKDHLVLHYDDDVNQREKTGTWSFPLTGCVYYPPGLSFEGGDLAIYTDGEDSTPELIKSRGNRLVIFDPGKVLHCVQKVTKGTRMGIAINLWEVEPWSVQKGYMLLD